MKKLLPILAVLAIAGCASTPASDIAATEATLAAADTAALAYVKLPTCNGKITLCKKPAVVLQIGQASSSAYMAVKAAEVAQTQTAIQQAQAAISVLQSIITKATTGG